MEDNLKIGDVVLMVDEQIRRGDWKTARVVKTEVGAVVRTVTVRTATGKEFLRDRTKVVKLELDPSRIVEQKNQDE